MGIDGRNPRADPIPAFVGSRLASTNIAERGVWVFSGMTPCAGTGSTKKGPRLFALEKTPDFSRWRKLMMGELDYHCGLMRRSQPVRGSSPGSLCSTGAFINAVPTVASFRCSPRSGTSAMERNKIARGDIMAYTVFGAMVLAVLTLLCGSATAEVIGCAHSPGKGDWVYRIVDGQRCWFPANGLRPRDELR